MVAKDWIYNCSLSLGFFCYAIALIRYVRSLMFGELGLVHMKMVKQSIELQGLIERNMNKINELESLLKGFRNDNNDNGSVSGT